MIQQHHLQQRQWWREWQHSWRCNRCWCQQLVQWSGCIQLLAVELQLHRLLPVVMLEGCLHRLPLMMVLAPRRVRWWYTSVLAHWWSMLLPAEVHGRESRGAEQPW